MVEKLGLNEAGTARRDWVAIRAAYESREMSPAAICEQYGITIFQLRYRRQKENWLDCRTKVQGRGPIINRMLRVLDQQVRVLEKQMPQSIDKEAALLGTMAKTLEKLIEIEKAERSSEPVQKKDISELRNKLARRIDQLKQR
ncbi:hypothetical protein PSQ90_02765 [Devosia rhodophyticola]|uniref:Transposase n=1 Tax=Devosia rhodophyticola TaxID=3026423 RepID=A0ABY7YYE0_9HYPH|nr:hypothetical protein [Devosia rhodophyticola]WDR06408.1 hypothetical protein PSQ90_02765 [Devosia rhodophyticola]